MKHSIHVIILVSVHVESSFFLSLFSLIMFHVGYVIIVDSL